MDIVIIYVNFDTTRMKTYDLYIFNKRFIIWLLNSDDIQQTFYWLPKVTEREIGEQSVKFSMICASFIKSENDITCDRHLDVWLNQNIMAGQQQKHTRHDAQNNK